MKLLLTGATGRVGSHLLPRLVAQGHDVRAVARSEVAAERVKAAGAEPVLADLLDPDGYRAALDGRDAVVHLAAVLRSTDDDEIRRANLEATRRLAGAAIDAGVARFVFTSTNLVYPGGLGRPASEDDEPAPPAAWGAYPASKAEAERALLALHRDRGLGLRIVRLAFVYGEGDPHLAESLRWAGPVARAPAAAAAPPRRRGPGGRPRPARPGHRRADLQRGRRVAGHRGGAARPQRRAVPRQPRRRRGPLAWRGRHHPHPPGAGVPPLVPVGVVGPRRRWPRKERLT